MKHSEIHTLSTLFILHHTRNHIIYFPQRLTSKCKNKIGKLRLQFSLFTRNDNTRKNKYNMPSKTLVHKSTSYQFYFHDFFNIFTIKSKVKRHSKYIKSAIYDYTLGKIFISCSNHVSKYFSQRGS